jgi:proteasome lid subunit RPN8/RPN11
MGMTVRTGSRTTTLYLPAPLAREIEQHGVRAYPDECCGILLGRDEATRRVVERVRPTENVFEDVSERRHRFSIDPLELLRAESESSSGTLVVLGFYHSHPDHPARPSDFDRSRAWPFYSYVIVSIQSRDAVDMTSWVLDDSSGAFVRQYIVEREPSGVT